MNPVGPTANRRVRLEMLADWLEMRKELIDGVPCHEDVRAVLAEIAAKKGVER